MNFFRGIVTDLRERKLLPVAVVLAVALVALPVLLHKSSDAPSATVRVDAATGSATVTGAPLVTLAALRNDSDLDTFDTKNPFRSLRPVAELENPALLADTSPTADSSSDGGSGGGSGGGDSDSGFTVPSNPPSGTPTTPPDDGGDDPPDNGDDDKTVTKTVYTHEVDLSFGTPGNVDRVNGIQRLSMLPDAEDPLLVFLGVNPNATKAVFLVDARLKQSGEGTCRDAGCAFIELGVGNVHVFTDEDGTRYIVRLDQIRTVAVKAATSTTPLRPLTEPLEGPSESLEPLDESLDESLDEGAAVDDQPATGATDSVAGGFLSLLFGDLVEVEVQQ